MQIQSGILPDGSRVQPARRLGLRLSRGRLPHQIAQSVERALWIGRAFRRRAPAARVRSGRARRRASPPSGAATCGTRREEAPSSAARRMRSRARPRRAAASRPRTRRRARASYDLHASACGSQTGSTGCTCRQTDAYDSGLGPSREPAGAFCARRRTIVTSARECQRAGIARHWTIAASASTARSTSSSVL